jgi:hypothetical protein
MILAAVALHGFACFGYLQAFCQCFVCFELHKNWYQGAESIGMINGSVNRIYTRATIAIIFPIW